MSHVTTHTDEVNFWHSVLKAVHAKPQALTQLRGLSGLRHDVIAVGVHDAAKRLVVVSGEYDGRIAALVQADIQGAFNDYHVLTIRPAAVSVPRLAQSLRDVLGSTIVTNELVEVLQRDKSLLNTIIEPAFQHFLPLRLLPQILELIQQLACLNISNFGRTELADGGIKNTYSIDLTNVLSYDPIAADRLVGVCGFPLYDFKLKDIDAITSSTSPETVAEMLKSRDILQYFFPGPDQLALGLVDRGIQLAEDVHTEVQRAPQLGHPLGPMEIVDPGLSALDVLHALQEKNLVVEGEFGFDISDEGKKTRFTARFKPKEGLISKLISRFSLKIDLKDIFGAGKNG